MWDRGTRTPRLGVIRTLEQQGRYGRGLSESVGTLLMIGSTLYAKYFGFTLEPITINYVRFWVQTAGAGTEVGEVGIASSPLDPRRSGQTLTKLTGHLDDIS